MDTEPGPSSEPLQKYDVFICHRGPDTKRTLACHLYDVLCLRGVKVFLDQAELQSGETLTKAIDEALECSDVDVCILSSGFAESPWCLRELVMMLDKHVNGTSTLIPIFYDVEPADVRHVKGDFGQGFQKLKNEDRYSSEDIDQWREALGKIGGLTGPVGKGEHCMTIVNRICELLGVGFMVTSGNIVGIEEQLRSTIGDIVTCCQNGSGVTLLEISGIPGIGKTTFAKELYNKIYSKNQRRRCCFIENVKGLVERGGVKEVYKELLSQLFKDERSCSLQIMKKHLWKRLQNTEILLVLDNIDKELPFRTVFIENVLLSPNSIIIVTCREKGVLKHDPAAIDLYGENLIQRKISGLDFDTSEELFCRYAFGGIDNAKHEFHELINKMVEKCDGIPLVLNSLGSKLRKTDIRGWNDSWNKIKDSVLPDAKPILKFIYDNLGSELEQSLFLDVATFFCWEKIELLVKVRQSDYEHDEQEVKDAIDALEKNLLIHVSDDGILGMHDVFVDLGKSIVEDEHKCPGSRSRVWHPSHVKNILSFEKGTEKVKALSLVSKGSQVVLDNDEYPWPSDAFSKMSSLEILILHGNCIEGDLSKLSRRLLWLKWTDFPLHQIPQTLCLKHVGVLHVSGERLIHLWEHSKQEAPSNLRELIIQDCIKLQSLPESSMGKLRHLSSMKLHGCTSLKTIPDSFGQLPLKCLKISQCRALECLPETFGGLTRLHKLTMKDCCSMVSLPESFGHLTSLSQLTIERCPTMVSLPESFGDLRRLSKLNIRQCLAMVSLPKSFGDLSTLSALNIRQCPTMVSLPESFGDLRRLSELNITQCPTMVSLPESFGDPEKLVQLHTLRIIECPALEWLSQTFVRLTNLVDVHVSQRGRISLSNASGHRSSLRLSVDEDDREVAHWLFGSTDLRHFIQPIQIQQQKYTAGLLLAAPNINIRRAPQLIDFEFIAPHVINSASRLRDRVSLYLGGLWNVKELNLCNLRHLVYLELRHCYNLQKLPEGLGSLSFLRDLCLEGCLNLEEVDPIGNLQNLRWLRIDTCVALKALPSCIGNLSKLERLEVHNCWMMEVIHTQALFSLAEFDVDSCVNVSRIVGFSHLSSLKILRLRGCVNLRQIMVRPGHRLRNVAIIGCYSFCDGQLSVNAYDGIFRKSYNNDAEDTEVLEWWLNATAEHSGILNVKASPALCSAVGQKMRELLGGEDMSSFFFYKLPPTHVHGTHVLSLPFIPHAVLVCLISSVYTADLPRHVPPPKTEFKFSTNYKHCYEPQYKPQSVIVLYPEQHQVYKYTSLGGLREFRRFDCGEEIHCAVLPFGIEGDIKSCDDDICLNIEKGKLIEKRLVYNCDTNHCHDPSYEALVKDGWIVYLGSRKVYLAKEIYKIFYSEFRKQRLISCTWTQLPSQLQIHEFSALDIAGCQITKISRHGNTCIMEEESGLIWSKRRCLFMDDHALLLHHPKGSEHSFLAYPEIDHDLERVVANLYEMSIFILVNGKVVSSRKLQQIIPIPEEKIPPHTQLQGRDFHSSSEVERWVKLLQRVKLLLQGRDFYSSSKTKLNLQQWMLQKVKKKHFRCVGREEKTFVLPSTDTEAESDTQAESDTDSDTAEGDTQAESDTDSDTAESDTEAESDTDSDTAESDTESES